MGATPLDEHARLRLRDAEAQRAMYFLFVRAAATITAAFTIITLTLGLIYDDRRRLMMSGLLFTYTAALLLIRRMARQSVERAAFITAVATLAGTVALAVLHPTIHSALVLAALFPAGVALQFARGRTQYALLVLSWLAAVAVGAAAEYVAPSVAVPEHLQRPIRLICIALASGVLLMLLWKFATRLFDRIDEAQAGQAAAAAASAALAAEHERLSVTLASIGEAVLVIDGRGRVTMLNEVATRVTGPGAHGQPLDEVCRFEDALGRTRNPVAEAAAEGRVVKADEPLTLVRADGRRFTVDGSAAPIRLASGEIVGSVLVLRDVSERVRLEEELREAQKLDAIGRLAGGVAHDFNNQLTSILGYSELLVWSFDENDTRRQDMEEIRRAADRAALVTQQLLAFSRRQILQPRLVHVADVVTRAARLLTRVLPGAIELETAIDEAIEPIVIDPHQLGHVLLNLAVSARDTMPDGGILSIRASNVAAGDAGLPGGRWVQLVVEDTGAGIPAERLPRVFEPFANQTAQSPGSLELAVVHGIVSQSGGRIHVASEAGKGTRFTLYFPAMEATVPARPDAAPAGGGERVLLVEDDGAVRTLLASTLERQGYSVVAVTSAAAALASMTPPVHALIVDVGLPEQGAAAVVQALDKRLPGLPVIYVCGLSVPESAIPTRTGRRLRKPFTPRELLVALREALDQSRPAVRSASQRP